jgi:L-arabinose isomerase
MKPKIGVLFITSGWFRKVGLQAEDSNLSDEVEKIAAETVKRLSEFMDPVYTGVIFSEREAIESAGLIYSSCVDGLLIASLMWCEDQVLRAALKELPELPIVVWVFSPSTDLPDFVPFQQMLKSSGSVGSLQMSGFLRREDRMYRSVVGYYKNRSVYEEISVHCKAFWIRKKLQRAQAGMIPFRCDQMSTTYVDEFKLRTVYGVELKYLQLETFRRIAQSVQQSDIEDFKRKLREENIVIEIDERNLNEGIKYALAMERLMSEERLNIFAMNDVSDEMHESLGLRPCLYNPGLADLDAVVSMESEIAGGVAMYILLLFTGDQPFYTEPFSPDFTNNLLLMGHAGYHDISNRDSSHPVKIVPDVEYENSDPFTGAVIYFKYRPGPVTVINSVFHSDRMKWVVFEGESLPGPPRMDGNCHLVCKPNPSLTDFYTKSIDSGVSQHWIVLPGHIKKDLEHLCDWLTIDYLEID